MSFPFSTNRLLLSAVSVGFSIRPSRWMLASTTPPKHLLSPMAKYTVPMRFLSSAKLPIRDRALSRVPSRSKKTGAAWTAVTFAFGNVSPIFFSYHSTLHARIQISAVFNLSQYKLLPHPCPIQFVGLQYVTNPLTWLIRSR